MGGGSPGWGSDTEGTEEGRKGWECPHCASLGCCMQDQTLPVLQEGLGERKGCRSWAMGKLWLSQRCHRADRTVVTQAHWLLSSADWTQVWMLLLEQGWNVGAPTVLSHSQECWGSPCPTYTPPNNSASSWWGEKG